MTHATQKGVLWKDIFDNDMDPNICAVYVEGMGHVTKIFREVYYFQSVRCVHAQMLLKFYAAL